MKIVIYSPKYGKFNVFFDNEYKDIVLKYNWSIHRKGKYSRTWYAVTNVPVNKIVYMHQLIMGFPKLKKGQQIDHKDENGLNNRRSNLRIGTTSQNIANSSIRKNNTSGFKGVSLLNGRSFSAYIKVNKKRIYGGQFKTALEAAKKYNEMALKYFGEFAKLNDVNGTFAGHLNVRPLEFKLGNGNKTGYRGVSKTPNRKTFISVIGVNGKRIVLGRYRTEKEAAIAYNNAVIKYGLPEYRLNKI